ncbi:hypothetical protein BOW53_07335 [Solemya pervernicosa gill symbiont]|uniref:Thiamine pyrimidine synthase n=1 Tax=Solemya pervernicosa gill symbiont TaxID=642797 RepID=A0A1T2L5Z6_9GAMM|nr:hypothetical protein BOW53_07335 [Solemya pervernicosa gill symbiont]
MSVATLTTLLTALLLLLLSPSVVAGDAQARDRPNNSDLTPVTLQLRWHHQFQFAGYYAALEKGYYRDAGLEVKIVAGNPDRSPINEILLGRADYGVDNSGILHRRLQGEPLVALAAIFQHSPSILLTRTDSGINSPHELVGRTIMSVSNTADAAFIAMLQNEGIALDSVEIINDRYNLEAFITGEVDALNAYITNEPYLLYERGIASSIIKPRNYGIDFYSDILFTSEALVHSDPEQVSAFRTASLRGWHYALTFPEEIIELIQSRYGSSHSIDHLHYEADTIRKLIVPDLVQIGHMNPGRWKAMAETYQQAGLIEPGYTLDGFIFDSVHGHIHDDRLWSNQAFRVAIVALFLIGLITLILLVFNSRLQREIGERRTTEEKLRQSESNIRSVFDNLQETFYRADTQGRVVTVSPSIEKLTGYTQQEMIGRNLSELYIDPRQRQQLIDAIQEQGGAGYWI